ncbi:phosphogluconate dehydratase [Limnohabitans curvus]|jgi:phosphogluconate dehydratase|uniref:Phosphogluconate dehydratase n=1 Tax=Limnohabitans curvus TaxID=323423 RepID=A0A315ES21_9BURK|nr:phosphogluconate dehydratase [Limnohabitans curvus]PUE60553.1 phosphogluconate dehydratase [Limnohabitans curvus]
MTVPLHATLATVTARIEQRSAKTRQAYLDVLAQAKKPGPYRGGMGCANAAHAYAAMPANDKLVLRQERQPNVGIITAYNDMLSAHQPYEHYPEKIRAAARAAGATAQVAGGVPAMCDGVTQGEDGMELSLFSRDVIALATAVGLSHNVFDAALFLGVCDKIVPGLFIGALQFGHLPAVFVPAGPMTSGLSNDDKAKVRQQYAQGLVSREVLLEAEQAAYHSAGTCTFYGTANSNQMLMEIMGLHLPGSSFVNPGTPLREALTVDAVKRAVALSQDKETGVGYQINAKVIVNGIVGLLATGGSTNHTLHIVAMARAAGILVNWDDFAELSACVPLLARVYPNGSADVNHFQAAGGMGYLMAQLLSAGLLHDDVHTIMGQGLHRYTVEPWLNPALNGQLDWRDVPTKSADEAVLRPVTQPFSADGGLRLLQGNLGRAVVKVSAVKPEHRQVRAPAIVLTDQKQLGVLFKEGKLERDFVAVVRNQGPQANGMPELHRLTPVLGVLQDKGFKVALVTDGRMSGASGKVPAAIHLSPESVNGGLIGKVQDGDMIALDCDTQTLQLEVSDAELAARTAPTPDLSGNQHGTGRDLFALFRANAALAEEGASPLFTNI